MWPKVKSFFNEVQDITTIGFENIGRVKDNLIGVLMASQIYIKTIQNYTNLPT